MKKGFRWFASHFAEVISGAGFGLMLVMVSVNVFSRYFLAKSFSASEELAYIGFNYSVFFGMCILYKKRAMIAIDIIVDRLPQKAQNAVNLFTYALLAVGNAVMCFYSAKLAKEAWIRPTAALRIPYTFVDLAAVLAFAVLTVYSVLFIIDIVRGKQLSDTSLEERA